MARDAQGPDIRRQCLCSSGSSFLLDKPSGLRDALSLRHRVVQDTQNSISGANLGSLGTQMPLTSGFEFLSSSLFTSSGLREQGNLSGRSREERPLERQSLAGGLDEQLRSDGVC